MHKARDLIALNTKAIEAFEVMKSFGHATTLHSTNSSRFGQFINILFNSNSEPVEVEIKTFLLENIRVVYQLPGERNFHIFYQIIQGLNTTEKELWKIYPQHSYHYASQTESKDCSLTTDTCSNSRWEARNYASQAEGAVEAKDRRG
jgi:myosin heavy subunit